MSGYTNVDDVQLLLQGFKDGFRLIYVGPRTSCSSQNLLSAERHQKETKGKLAKEIALGRIIGPFRGKPISKLRISPIGLVQK